MKLKTKLVKLASDTVLKFKDRSCVKYFVNERQVYTTQKLNKEQKRQVKEYYKPYSKTNLLFHAFYTEKTNKFEASYIPDDLWFTDIDRHFNNRQKAKVIDHKSYYERIFAGKNVKHPETILHRINGFWYNSKMEMLSEDEAEKLVKFEQALFIKVSQGSCGGRGVKFVSQTNGKDIVEDFKKFIRNKKDVVVQRVIKQHPELSRVGESSLNTLRILSLLNEKEVKIYSSILRMGIGNSKVDNASSGGIICGIEEDGRLKDPAYTMYGEKFNCHPTTNVKFSDVVIPSFDKALNLVKDLHPMIPDFRLVSWDIAINSSGEPILLEVNLCMGGLDFHQLTNGPVFKEDTEKILTEVFGKNK